MTLSVRWPRWAPFLLLAIAAFAAYANSLRGPFVFDDGATILDNPSIRHLWPPGDVLAAPPVRGATSSGRPLVNVSLAINHALGDGVFGYHLFNLIIHLLAAWVLFSLLRRTLPKLGLGDGAAFAAALLWTVHPLATEAVSYTVQRAEAMMALCYLLTLDGFAQGRLTRSWLAGLAGMACKEVMISAPLIVLLYDRTFESGTFAAAWRRHRAYYLALASTWLLLAWEVAAVGNRGGTAGFGGQVTPWAYLLSQFPAIVHYLRLCVWPAHLIFDYGTRLTSDPAAILPAGAAVLALLLLTAWSLRRRPPLGFALTTFFAVLAPSTSIIPIPTEVAAEHRMYLPLAIVLATLVAAIALQLKKRTPISARGAAQPPATTGGSSGPGESNPDPARVSVKPWPDGAPLADGVAPRASVADRRARGENPLWGHLGAVVTPAVGLLTVILLIATIRRNRDYQSIETLWRSAAANAPTNARARTNLGFELGNQGRYAEAIAEFQTALAADPSFADAENNLGSAYLQTGNLPAAAAHFAAAERLAPQLASPHYNLGAIDLLSGNTAASLAEYTQSLALEPASPEAHYNYAHALAQLQRYNEAIAQARQALYLRPASAEAYNVLGACYLSTNRSDAARQAFAAGLALAPPPPLAATLHFNLGNLAQSARRLPEAISEYRTALALNPGYARAHSNLGAALFRSGDARAAQDEFQTALRLDPMLPDARTNLARVREFERVREASPQQRGVRP